MSNRRKPDWAYKARKSVAHFPGDNSTERIHGAFMASMFAEDIRLGIVPIGGEAREKFLVRIAPEDPSVEEAVLDALGHSVNRWRDTLSEGIADFIEEAVGYLSYFGEVWYEVVRAKNDSPGERARLVLLPLPPGRITRLGPSVIQHVPLAAREVVCRRLVALPNRDVWHLTLPKELGTPKRHRELLDSLARARRPIPDFAIADMRLRGNARHFDFVSFRREVDAESAAVTRAWGWPCRTMWQESTLEYFLLYRQLRFAMSKARLREHVLYQLNELLRHEGFECSINLSGIQDSAAYKQLLRDLESGRVGFRDVVRAIYGDMGS
jgi:hypothetical protein